MKLIANLASSALYIYALLTPVHKSILFQILHNKSRIPVLASRFETRALGVKKSCSEKFTVLFCPGNGRRNRKEIRGTVKSLILDSMKGLSAHQWHGEPESSNSQLTFVYITAFPLLDLTVPSRSRKTVAAPPAAKMAL
jgi:hypothetical protein